MSTVSQDVGNAAGQLHDLVTKDAPSPEDLDAAMDVARIRADAEDLIRRGHFDSGVFSLSNHQGRLRALFAVDRALLEASGDHAGSAASATLPELATRLAVTGRFDTPDSKGAVLARRTKCPRPGPPDVLHEALVGMVRVPPAVWKNVDFVVPGPGDRLRGKGRGVGGLVVGCVAFSEDFADFDIREVPHATGIGYTLGPSDESAAVRIDAIASGPTASTLDLLVVPEGTLDDVRLAAWQSGLRQGNQSGLAIAGTGPVAANGTSPAPNRAVVLSARSGEPVATQDKRNRFTLTPRSIKDYQLRTHLPEPADHVEAITTGKRITVIETRAGRIVIAVCEDLSRVFDEASVYLAVAPSLTIVPVFSKEIVEDDWTRQHAQELAERIGCYVVVANSLAVAREREAAGEVMPKGWGTSVVFRPHTSPPAVEVKKAADATEVAVHQV
jgi:predicted amidohydrolase